MSYSAAAIGLAGLGLNSYVQRLSKRYGPGTQMVQSTMPMGKADYNSLRLQALSRQVNRIKPATEQTTRAFSLATVGAAAVEANVQITTDFGTDSDFQSKVLGDKVRLLRYDLRYNFSTSTVSVARFILYQPYNVGERITGIDYQSIIDSSKFRVLKDWTIWPSLTNASVRGNVALVSTKLGGRITRYDRSNATTMVCQAGEYVLFSLITSTATSSTGCQHRLTFQNK